MQIRVLTVRTYMMLLLTIYIVAIAVAELSGALISLALCLWLHAILVPALLINYLLMSQTLGKRMFPVLALASLLRIISLTVATSPVPHIYWYGMAGIPLLIAVVLTMRLLGLAPADLGLCIRPWAPQLIISLTGVPLGVVAFLILRPRPLIVSFDWRHVAVGSIILLVFTGFTEEIIFRGLLQKVAGEIFGRASLLVSGTVFAIMHFGSLSLSYVLFMGLVGFFFGWCASRTGSIYGVILAHTTLVVGAGLFWPFRISPPVSWATWIGLIIVCGEMAALIWRLSHGRIHKR